MSREEPMKTYLSRWVCLGAEENLRRAREEARRAVATGAELVVFPELFLLGQAPGRPAHGGGSRRPQVARNARKRGQMAQATRLGCAPTIPNSEFRILLRVRSSRVQKLRICATG